MTSQSPAGRNQLKEPASPQVLVPCPARKMAALQEEVGELERSVLKVNLEEVEKVRVEEVKELSKKVESYPDKLIKKDPAGHVRNPELIFPEEIWEIIFNGLSDWNDLSNVRDTCAFFKKILSKRNPTFLFPQAFPDIFKHLEGAEILQCRKVCRAWSNGVDQFLENHKSHRPHDDESCDPRDPAFIPPMEEKKLDTPKDVVVRRIHRDGFWNEPEEQTETPDRNPFIGRAVTITNLWGFLATENILERYGQHIWYLTASIDWNCKCLFGCVCLVRGMFEHVFIILQNLPPNLRKLRIVNTNPKDGPYYPYEPHYACVYPALDNLDTLQCETSPFGIHRGLCYSFHLQLKRVEMRAVHWLSVYKLGWPALVELHLQDLSTSGRHYESLLKAEMPNLRKLGCGSNEDDCDSRDMLDRILNIITDLSEITPLNTVRINEHISKGWRTRPSDFTIYAPPSLKTLEMEHFCDSENDLTNYSVLLHFPLIENINVYWRGVKKFNDGDEASDNSDSGLPEQDVLTCAEKKRISKSELIQVNRYINQKELYKSNIWELLPNLKVLTVHEDLYTRGNYENFNEYTKGNNSDVP